MLQRFLNLLLKKAVVLMYHRIAEPDTDPWQLSVSPARFEEHLKVLRDGYRVVPVADLAGQLAKGKVNKKSVCITFDDGYTDNFLYAKPLLEKYRSPASFFLATQYLGRAEVYWWDELEIILLRTATLPARLQLEIRGKGFDFQLEHEGHLTPAEWEQHRRWVWPEPAPTRRCMMYLALWEEIRPLPFEEIKAVMKEIRAWSASDYSAPVIDYPMSLDQAREFLVSPLFDIGLHTHTHCDLGAHTRSFQLQEISACAAFLQAEFMHTSRTIAYPYGRYNADTLSLAQDLQLQAAFTTHTRFVSKHTDPLQIPRFQVKNWTGEEFAQQLRIWSKSLL